MLILAVPCTREYECGMEEENGVSSREQKSEEQRDDSSRDVEKTSVRRPGEAAIKPQYILKRKVSCDDQPVNRTTDDGSSAIPGEDGPPPAKRRKKQRGQNKHRPRAARISLSEMLCPSLHHGRPRSSSPSTSPSPSCQFGEKCRYCHDCAAFLSTKPPDIGDHCYLFETFGRCPYGLACRYGSSHMTSDHRNVTNEEVFDPNRAGSTTNVITKSLQEKLRKRKLEFPKSEAFLRTIASAKGKGGGNVAKGSGGGEGRVEGGEGGTGEDSMQKITEDMQSENDVGASHAGSSIQSFTEKSSSGVTEGDGTMCASDGAQVGVGGEGDGGEVEGEGVSGEDGEISGGKVLGVEDTGVKVGVSTEEKEVGVAKTIGVTTDEDLIRLQPSEKKKVDFRDKLYLAPLTTVGNLPFRRICKEFGADITCGEMAMSTNLLQGQQSEWALLKRHQSEDIFGVQVCGAHVDSMTRCAEMITTQAMVDFIDVNVGCPIDLVFKKGAGCALMERHTRFQGIVRGMVEVMDCPLTVKMRTGVYNKNWNAHKLMPKLKDWGVAMAIVHGRSREQRYTKLADWSYISRCVEAASPMPVFGCGDVLSYEDYNLFRHTSQVAGIMVARGALIKPWVFTEIKEQRHWDISSSERLDILRRYVNYGLEHWGSDTMGVENTRKFLLEWLSFLYRYIPVGLLERVPQKINERPPHFRGRDDLETLMASNNCQDWVKISEMLLGPVPPNFSFLPKHKANSYS